MPAVALQTLAFPLSNIQELCWSSTLLAPLSDGLAMLSGRMGASSLSSIFFTALLVVLLLLAVIAWFHITQSDSAMRTARTLQVRQSVSGFMLSTAHLDLTTTALHSKPYLSTVAQPHLSHFLRINH